MNGLSVEYRPYYCTKLHPIKTAFFNPKCFDTLLLFSVTQSEMTRCIPLMRGALFIKVVMGNMQATGPQLAWSVTEALLRSMGII